MQHTCVEVEVKGMGGWGVGGGEAVLSLVGHAAHLCGGGG